MATQPTTGLTVQDLFAIPDDEEMVIRELIDRELFVTPTPTTRHQDVVLELGAALLAYTKEHGGRVFVSPTGIYLSEVNFVEPDVVYIRPEHADRVDVRRLEHGRFGEPKILTRSEVLETPAVPGFRIPVEDVLGPVED